MNSAAVLALIGDLYVQIDTLQQENETLKKPTQASPGRTEVHTRGEGTIPAVDPLKAKQPEPDMAEQEPEFPRKADPSDFVYDTLGGTEEAIAQARKESEG